MFTTSDRRWNDVVYLLAYNSFKVLITVTKSSILHVTAFLGVPLIIEKIDLSFVLWLVFLDC